MVIIVMFFIIIIIIIIAVWFRQVEGRSSTDASFLQLHNKQSNQSQSSEPGLGGAAQGGSASAAPETGKKSNLEKVKEKLHLNK